MEILLLSPYNPALPLETVPRVLAAQALDIDPQLPGPLKAACAALAHMAAGPKPPLFVTANPLHPTIAAAQPAQVLDARSQQEQARWVMERALTIGQWERSMDPASLLAYLEEETEEFAQAVNAWHHDPTPAAERQMRAELADVYLQILFHAQLAARRGSWDIEDVAADFVAKMRSRAPYIFRPGAEIVPVEEQERLWQEGKRKQSGPVL